MKKQTVVTVHKAKEEGRKLACLTAYDFTMASIVDKSKAIDLILVGDSLASVVQGHKHTLPVTMDEMVYHARCVRRGVEHALLVADMPFLSYQVSKEEALLSAGRLFKEAGAEAVKLEGGVAVAETIAALVAVDMPVMGHIGLTPQSYHRMGGHKIQGKRQDFSNNTAGTKERLIEDANAVEAAGAFSIVLEGVPEDLAKEITALLSIPTIGIASGEHACDGEILVTHDLLGFSAEAVPAFVKPKADLASIVTEAVSSFSSEVKAR